LGFGWNQVIEIARFWAISVEKLAIVRARARGGFHREPVCDSFGVDEMTRFADAAEEAHPAQR
jgi:hypothetical protein